MSDPSSSYLKCPFCGGQDNRVLETRETKASMGLRRRRYCMKCEKPFGTLEVPFDFLKHRLNRDLPTADALIEFLEKGNGKAPQEDSK